MAEDSNGADQNAPAGAAATGQDADPKKTGARFVISSQYVRDFSFENPNAPQIYGLLKQQPKIAVNVDVNARSFPDNYYEVILKVSIDAKAEDKAAFMIELEYAGLCQLNGELEEAMKQHILLVEVPQNLFPFARAILSKASQDGGFPPLLLSPIDFRGMLVRQAEAARDQAPAPEGEA
ncbi:MAG: protein-export chaperone SecB [Limibacillus sp.]|jgi:preprotein translocase subunit SecB